VSVYAVRSMDIYAVLGAFFKLLKPKAMTITEKLNEFIAKDGKGNVCDALNVALARLDQKQLEIESRDLQIKLLEEKIEQLECDLEMVGAGF